MILLFLLELGSLFTAEEDVSYATNSEVQRGCIYCVALIISNASLAGYLDRQTLQSMFFSDPGGSRTSSKIFCFGAERDKGFRPANWLMGEAFVWGLLHLFGAKKILPKSIACDSIELPLLVTFVTFTYILVFFGIAAYHREWCRRNGKRHNNFLITVMCTYFLIFCLVLLSLRTALLPTIISATATVAATAYSLAQHSAKKHKPSVQSHWHAAAMTLCAALIVHLAANGSAGGSLLGVVLATVLTFVVSLRFLPPSATGRDSIERSLVSPDTDMTLLDSCWSAVKCRLPIQRIPAAVWPAVVADRQEARCSNGRHRAKQSTDSDGVPMGYYDCGDGRRSIAPDGSARASFSRLLSATAVVTVCGMAGRGEIIAVPILVLHSIGIDLPGIGAAVGGDWRCVLAWVIFSAFGAAHGYYGHCTEIERWKSLQPKGSEALWKCQPDRFLCEEKKAYARRLGTFNAGMAAVLGMATSLLHLQGGHTKMYFDIDEFGIAWYVVSFVVFFTWVEAFAYAFHRLFHLKFIYKHLHKLHHTFQPPTSFSAVAFHPVEFGFYVLGGQMIFFVLPIHPSVMLVVGGYTAYYLIEDHSGIKATAPWPWQPTSLYHDDHHRYFHVNFGQHVLWFDWIFGTLRTVRRTYGEECFGGKGHNGIKAVGKAVDKGAEGGKACALSKIPTRESCSTRR